VRSNEGVIFHPLAETLEATMRRIPPHTLLAALPVAIVLACADGAPETEDAPEAAAPVESTTPAPQGPLEVSAEDQEAILQTGLLGEWRWIGVQGMDDSRLDVDDPSRYTLTFRVDGVAVQADCNRGRGTFDLEGSSITFGPIATTLMACPDESVAARYLRSLGEVRSWLIEEDHLFLSLGMDGGIMEFEPGQGPAE
jgi:heat shock protein HslJ